MNKVVQGYRLINILSLDIVAGSVLCALFFGRILRVDILPYGLMALALTVWVIYTADHLRDAKSIKRKASSERHRFHQQHFSLLLACEVGAIILDCAVIFFMRKPVLQWGIVLSALVLIYLIVQRYLKFLKEAFVACLYTCGVILPSIATTSEHLSINHLLMMILFGMIALLNLFIFSWFDFEADKTDDQESVVTTFGKIRVATGIWVTGVINFSIGIYLLVNAFFSTAVIILLMMNAVLMAIYLFRRKLSMNDLYRLIGDAVFLLPAIYLL